MRSGVSKQVYDNDELKESSNVKVQREAATPTMSHLKSVVMFAFLLPRGMIVPDVVV